MVKEQNDGCCGKSCGALEREQRKRSSNQDMKPEKAGKYKGLSPSKRIVTVVCGFMNVLHSQLAVFRETQVPPN